MTIQEVIRNCDRKEVIGEFLYNHRNLNYWDCPQDVTVGELKGRIEKHLNEIMDKLCDMTPKPNEDKMVLLAVHTVENDNNDIAFNLFKVKDLMEDKEYYTSYGYEFTPFEETLDFDVADTYLTQYYLNGLIADYLYEVTWTGWNQDNLKEELNQIRESAKEAEEHPERLIKWDSEKFEEEYGLEKKDPKQEEAWRELIWAQVDYHDKCMRIEIEKYRALVRNGQ